MNINELNKN